MTTSIVDRVAVDASLSCTYMDLPLPLIPTQPYCLLFAVECWHEYLGHASLCVLCLQVYASGGATLQLTDVKLFLWGRLEGHELS